MRNPPYEHEITIRKPSGEKMTLRCGRSGLDTGRMYWRRTIEGRLVNMVLRGETIIAERRLSPDEIQ